MDAGYSGIMRLGLAFATHVDTPAPSIRVKWRKGEAPVKLQTTSVDKRKQTKQTETVSVIKIPRKPLESQIFLFPYSSHTRQ